jgi:hypothetical protein
MIYLHKSNSPNYGLVCVRKRWFLVFREDGVQRRIALSTTDEQVARAHRDAAYVKLVEAGAQLGCKIGRPKIIPPAHSGEFPEGVFYRHPWQAKAGTKNLGNFATMAEAEARIRSHQEKNVTLNTDEL